MDTSVSAVNNAVLEVLQRAGEVGLHVDNLVKLLGFTEKKQILPRLYNLHGRKLIEKLNGQIWRVKVEKKMDKDQEDTDDPMTSKTDFQNEQKPQTTQFASYQGNSKTISYKNILQEYCQKQYVPVPSYRSEKTDFGFLGIVSFGAEQIKSRVAMPSMKESEQMVAFEALKITKVLPDDAKYNVPAPFNLPSRKRKPVQTFPSASPASKIQNMQQQDCFSWKNLLQETAQKNNLKIPEYHVSMNGNNFVATVEFQGRTFTSINSFDKKKSAEQNAALVALHALGVIQTPPTSMMGDGTNSSTETPNRTNMQGNNMPSTPLWMPSGSTHGSQKYHSNDNFKNRLQEYVQKNRAALPEYITTYESLCGSSGFVCRVSLGGRVFQGNLKQCKKDAEKDAARVAMISLGLIPI